MSDRELVRNVGEIIGQIMDFRGWKDADVAKRYVGKDGTPCSDVYVNRIRRTGETLGAPGYESWSAALEVDPDWLRYGLPPDWKEQLTQISQPEPIGGEMIVEERFPKRRDRAEITGLARKMVREWHPADLDMLITGLETGVGVVKTGRGSKPPR